MAQLEPSLGEPLKVTESEGPFPPSCLCSECGERGGGGCVRWREWSQAPEALLRLFSVSVLLLIRTVQLSSGSPLRGQGHIEAPPDIDRPLLCTEFTS